MGHIPLLHCPSLFAILDSPSVGASSSSSLSVAQISIYTNVFHPSTVQGMLSRLQGQPESYDKKAKYRFGKTLGAGTYGIVREADGPTGKVAIKIILKKNVKGNERMVWDELDMLQRLKHPHIVRFVDWFESRDKYYIVTELATGGELFDRICEQGKFTEKDASQTIKQVLTAVDYLHRNNVVHRGMPLSKIATFGIFC